jgi:hypothetical protein
VPAEIIFPTPDTSLASAGPVFVVLCADATVASVTVTCYLADQPCEGTVGTWIETFLDEDDGTYQWTFLIELPSLDLPATFFLAVVWTDKLENQGAVGGTFTADPVPAHGRLFTVTTCITSPTKPGPIPTAKFITTGTNAAPLETAPDVAQGGQACCTQGYPCLFYVNGQGQQVQVPRFALTPVGSNWSATYKNLPAGQNYTEQVLDIDGHGQTLPGLTT